MDIWKKQAETDNTHTAETVYVTEGYKIWKGKYRVFSVIYSANEWHLERVSDRKILYSARTAKECKENFNRVTNRQEQRDSNKN